MRKADAAVLIVKLQTHFPLRVADWLLAGIIGSWGLTCLYVGPATWSLTIYDGLRRIASQETWGLVAFILGFLRMIALFINGAIRRTPHVRAAGAFFSAFLWLQLSFAMFNTAVPTIAVGVYPWLFVGEIYNVFRASRDARLSDNRANRQITPRGAANAQSAQT